MSSESGEAPTELASASRMMMKSMAAGAYVAGAKTAAGELKTTLKIISSEITAIVEILPAATILSYSVKLSAT